jgi:hypothetical protein
MTILALEEMMVRLPAKLYLSFGERMFYVIFSSSFDVFQLLGIASSCLAFSTFGFLKSLKWWGVSDGMQ